MLCNYTMLSVKYAKCGRKNELFALLIEVCVLNNMRKVDFKRLQVYLWLIKFLIINLMKMSAK